MRVNPLLSSLLVVLTAGVLGVTACSEPPPPEKPLPITPISDMKDGQAVRFETDGTGNCSFAPSPQDLKVAAVNPTEFAESGMCGACAELESSKGTVLVRVTDRCQDCSQNQIALSKESFEAMGGGDYFQMQVRWRYVTCPLEGPVRYFIKEDSSAYWTAIQIRNHLVPIQKLEWQKDGTWVEAKRAEYNYFVEPSGMGTGPVRVRVTASNGQVLEDTLPQISPGLLVEGGAQFTLN